MSPQPLSPADATHVAIPHTDLLDDVFGSDDSPVSEKDLDEPGREYRSTHPSDLHRLQQEHTTAGYRDGIATAKVSSVQAGFDEGFGLGGTIGLKVGRLLGLVEGIVDALAADESAAVELASASQLLAAARAELALRSVFSAAYWNPDGTWKYEVGGGGGRAHEGAVLFAHVAEAHPLVRQWTATVEALMGRWGLQEQLPLLQRREDEEGAVAEPAAYAKAPAQPHSEAKAPSDALSW